MLHTRLGTIAIGCAAVDDITAWLLLAAITLSTHGIHQQVSLSWSILGLAVYFGVMCLIVKPWLVRLRNRHPDSQFAHKMLTLILLLVLGSALATEWLGMHALFGAFFAGFIMPKDEPLIRHLTEKIEPVTSGLFLPIFFALTGLRTSITLLNGPEMWFYFGLVLAIAVTGKLFGSLVSARLTGMSWREAGAIGILMNTRGLIELVILNIGFDLGLIPATLFSMMVLMALVTTFMTSPLLALLYPAQLYRPAPASLPQTP